ncbi:transcription factor IIA subunit alpha [Coemansia javaensis]|uniref:Transcription initiation factor IIA large subunit n=1 Tax=Coemansia javaensis TaxID=2761396 RepID=A0A9W8LGD4_9FUNG|nr:transcription factor IIA subunit alpha [Coemansia javaensis]
MSNSIVAAIYRYVIDDVVRNVQSDFEGHGVDTSVLEELQRNWEAKIIQSRVASFPGDDMGGAGVYGHHAAQYRTTAAPESGPGGASGFAGAYHYPQHQAAHRMVGAHDHVGINSAASLASIINNPDSAAPSAASLASLAQSGRDALIGEDEDIGGGGSGSGSYHYGSIPQEDGAGDAAPRTAPAAAQSPLEQWRAMCAERRRTYKLAGAVPQVDGASDDDEDDDNDNDNDDGRKGGPAAAGVEAPEDAINSDLDSDGDNEHDEETEHIILCQYEKVNRSKNKWKCVLRDGIMLINGRDYLFQRANGDFEW